MSQIAITLARSGSKGLPNKNIMEINGISISHYPIIASNFSEGVSRIVYSSDSEEYLRRAERFFASNDLHEVVLDLHLRSADSSNDQASSWAAVEEVISDLALSNQYQGVLLLAATCPSMNGIDIDYFLQNIELSCSAMTVREVDYPIENTFCSEYERFKAHKLTKFLSARQERDIYYRPDGHFYYRSFNNLLGEFPNERTKLINLNKDLYVNVDCLNDFKFAKAVMETAE